MDENKVLEVIRLREDNRPVNWIARETGLTRQEVTTILSVAGDRLAKHEQITVAKYDQIEYWVEQGASLSMIMAETRTDNRTIKKWFPEAGWEHTGSGKAAEVRKMYEELDALDVYGARKKAA